MAQSFESNLQWLLDMPSDELATMLEDFARSPHSRNGTRTNKELLACLRAVNSLRSFPGTSDQSATLAELKQKLDRICMQPPM